MSRAVLSGETSLCPVKISEHWNERKKPLLFSSSENGCAFLDSKNYQFFEKKISSSTSMVS
jgi:hypothetical protein